MRASAFAFLLPLLSLPLVACGVSPSDPTPTAPAPAFEPAPPPPRVTVAPPKEETTTTVTAESAEHAEVVYVVMHDSKRQSLWFCTGTLVSKKTVVTAAHCLDHMFVRYEVTAPLAAGEPTVRASRPEIFIGSPENVANPDIGFLTLETPIALGTYASLTDVVTEVEKGEPVVGGAILRTDEDPYAPLEPAGHYPVTSTVNLGYDHGFGTPMFTKGGDSGGGLFLVENGKLTHKLIGVARQPEPDRDLDHFTRIDPAFLAWFNAKLTEAGDL